MRLATLSLFLVAVVGPMMRPRVSVFAAPTATSSGTCDLTSTRVILRKLHLVRPDLILYPLNYEVLC